MVILILSRLARDWKGTRYTDVGQRADGEGSALLRGECGSVIPVREPRAPARWVGARGWIGARAICRRG